MLKTLLAQVKEFKTPSILTPVCMIGEVICEMIIPVLMGRIVDIGIGGSDMGYIVRTGLVMLCVAVVGLIFGILGAVFGFIIPKLFSAFVTLWGFYIFDLWIKVLRKWGKWHIMARR